MTATTVHIEAAIAEGQPSFWAVSGQKQAIGRTPGEALDELLHAFPDGLTEPLVVLPRNQPDAFFTAEQQRRLKELIALREQATLNEAQSQELAILLDEELVASGHRALAWHQALHP